jgi:4-amino-4-deoxy-L-arabinose transferase-like glycosyltransferase
MKKGPDSNILLINLLIAAAAAVMFIPFLGGVHLFDWDEINFAESAREMIVSGDYTTVQINFIPFWEKPPLFIWMQVLSMKIFGINEFAARFPNAICGIVSLLVLFNMGRKLRDTRFGIIWVLMYGGSILPFLYFKSGIIDPWFNLFIFTGIYHFHLYFESENHRSFRAGLSALFIGLAILTKGPVALLIFLLTFGIFLLVRKFKVAVRFKDILIFAGVLIVSGGFWFILQILKGNFSIITDFIIYQIRLFKTQDAGHGGFLLYHFVVLFFGVFPASVLALPALFPSKYKAVPYNAFYIWMLILFWVVLILFTIVRTKIVHYSSLCYFPLTFLAAWALSYERISYTRVFRKISNILIITTGFLIGLLAAVIPFTDQMKQFIIPHISDQFAVANLSADAGWKGYESVAGALLIAGIIYFIVSKNFNRSVKVIAITVPVFMFLALTLIVPKVEAYSQRAAVEFFESVSNEDAYLSTIGYKSYAHLFYGKTKKHLSGKQGDKEWLLNGTIDKPAYFSVKVTRKAKFISDYPKVEYLYEKNGFAFFKRVP